MSESKGTLKFEVAVKLKYIKLILREGENIWGYFLKIYISIKILNIT